MKKLSLVFVILFLVATGCALFDKSAKTDPPAGTSPPRYEPLNQAFYGFPDVPVPKELTFVPEKSFVYETMNLRVGVMILRGNVDLQSLENYFKVNMLKNGWRFVNSFKFRDIAMNFAKEDRTCNIKMNKESFSAEVEVWVGPATALTAPQPADKGMMQKDN